MSTSNADISAIVARKKELRFLFKKIRQKASLKSSIEAINRSLFKQVAATQLPIIGGFYPVGDEISVLECLVSAQKCSYETALPVVIKPNLPLIFRQWQQGDILAKGAFDIPEPEADKRCCTPNFLIVPLLAFDALGYRLGYGGGFYDRTIFLLKQANPQMVTVGVAYEVQKSPDLLPTDSYDQSLDYIVTEQKIHKFG